MHTIKEEPEEFSDEEEFIRKCKTRESLSAIEPKDKIRTVGRGWVEYVTPSGRLYYHNAETDEKSWKPPRKLIGEKSEVQSRTCSLPPDAFLPQEWKSSEFCSEQNLDIDSKPTNVGKILRTGMLKTKTVEVNGEKVKKKWVKSFVVLTEFFILLTTVVGSFQKLFKKTKTPKPSRYYLVNAEVVKDTENVYKLKTPLEEILFRSKNPTSAESWYQALALVINNLKDGRKYDQFDLKELERTNSFDFGVSRGRRKLRSLSTKSTSLSDFSVEETVADGPNSKCLSDFFGAKYATPPGWITIFDAETEQFCYVNCITKKKWFRAMTDDGHPYFYEEGCTRRAWLLPSIYLDVNSQLLHEFRRSMDSQKSLRSIT